LTESKEGNGSRHAIPQPSKTARRDNTGARMGYGPKCMLDIHERDIGPELCRRCAECCRIRFKLANTDSRYRRFLRQIGYRVLPAAAEGRADCCEKRHDARVDTGYCQHLEITEQGGDRRFRCRIYRTKDFPDLCAQYNCVSWAKVNDDYHEQNATLVAAQRALDGARNVVRQSGPGPASA